MTSLCFHWKPSVALSLLTCRINPTSLQDCDSDTYASCIILYCLKRATQQLFLTIVKFNHSLLSDWYIKPVSNICKCNIPLHTLNTQSDSEINSWKVRKTGRMLRLQWITDISAKWDIGCLLTVSRGARKHVQLWRASGAPPKKSLGQLET